MQCLDIGANRKRVMLLSQNAFLIGVKNSVLLVAAGKKIKDRAADFFYYSFLYHGVLCNNTQQLIKNKLTH